MNKFDTISSDVILSNPYWDYVKELYVLPSGANGEYHFVKSRGSVMIIPSTKNGKIIMTGQYRYLNKKYSFEFAGGGIKPNSDPFQSAIEELKEETGYVGDIEMIGSFNPFNGVTNEICYVFTAKNCILTVSSPDESEEIVSVEMTTNEIIEKIKNGDIWDGMTIAAFSIYFFKNQ